MKSAESSIIHLLRSVTLLSVLVFVPGIAVFWNHLPKNVVNSSESSPSDEVPIPREDSIEPSASPAAPKFATESSIQQVSWESSATPSPPPLDFASLERRLKALGATHYQLAKWGNQGDLFRFVCLVTSSEPYVYEKQFQGIGPDALTVMQSVIADVEKWKSGTP